MANSCWLSRARGWRGRRESDSQVFCHPNSVHLCSGMDRRIAVTSRPHHNHHNHQLFLPFCGDSVMDASGQPTGAAQRRRQRRLRSWWRHEQQSFAAILATFQHHSAPRGPKMARTGEVEEHGEYDAPRRQTAPEARPGILVEPGQKRSERSLRHFSGTTPPRARVACGCRGRRGRRCHTLLPHSPSAGRQRRRRSGKRRRG